MFNFNVIDVLPRRPVGVPALRPCTGPLAGSAGSFSSTLFTTAHHEAGHAVAGVAVGATVERVTIVADARTLGQTVVQHAQDVGALRRVVHVLAGPLAECRHTGRSFVLSEYRSDRDRVIHFITTRSAIPEHRALDSATYATALDLAQTIVAARWAQIGRVAVELILRGTLDHHQLAHAMRVPEYNA